VASCQWSVVKNQFQSCIWFLTTGHWQLATGRPYINWQRSIITSRTACGRRRRLTLSP
jgi:hypothetical protein